MNHLANVGSVHPLAQAARKRTMDELIDKYTKGSPSLDKVFDLLVEQLADAPSGELFPRTINLVGGLIDRLQELRTDLQDLQ